jgi:hypothetical protein
MLVCRNKDCKAQSKFILRPEFIFKKTDGIQRNIYFINRDDKKILNLANWEVCKYKNRHFHSESLGLRGYAKK